jgi:hypothetical protein
MSFVASVTALRDSIVMAWAAYQDAIQWAPTGAKGFDRT